MKIFQAFKLFLPVTFLLLTGCASGDFKMTPTGARSCCTSASMIPTSGALQGSQTITLDLKSPHFDFGYGLAPTVSLELKDIPTGTAIDLMARSPYSMQLAVQKSYFATASVIFLGTKGEVIQSPVTKPFFTTVPAVSSPLVLARTTHVPAGASRVIIFTDPRTAGTTEALPVDVGPITYAAGGFVQEIKAKREVVTFENAYYGDILIRAHSIGKQ